MYRGGRGDGGRFHRVPPSRWSNHNHHPYRGGRGPVPRMGPVGAGRNFHGHGRDNGPDRGSSVKLYVASIPPNATEEDIRPLFEEHGYVTEVFFIKDRRTGQPQSCFVKYATLESAEKAITVLNEHIILPGASFPMKVRLADGERARVTNFIHDKPSFIEFKEDTPTMETQCQNLPAACPYPNEGISGCKLYVGSLSKQATEKDIMEIFSPFGVVEDVYIMRDQMMQSRGVCFVKYSNKEMSETAIRELNGTYVMSDHVRPLNVWFADPKKPKPGDFRVGPTHMNPGFHPRPNAPLGHRSISSYNDQLDAHSVHAVSRSFSPQPNEPPFKRGLHMDPGFYPPPKAPIELRPTSAYNDQLDVHSPNVASVSFSPQPNENEPPLQNNVDSPKDPSSISLSVHSATPSCEQVNKPEETQTVDVDPHYSAEQNIHSDIQRESSIEQKDTLTMNQPQQHPMDSSPQQQSQHGSMLQSDSTTSSQNETFHIPCKWSEHFSPDGFKYYYNCITRESKWEKPKEYADFELQMQEKLQEQQKSCSAMHMSSPSHIQSYSHNPPIEASQ